MSTVIPKRKGKRSRSPSNDANNSFVKNVTSRVTGLLPSTITKWFSSPSSSTTNGSAPTADSDSSTEDEVIESPVPTQPPTKRMRYSPSTTPGKLSNHYISLHEVNSVPENKMHEIADAVEPCTSYSIQSQSPPGRTTYRRETNFVSTQVASSPEHTAVEQDRDNSSYKSPHSVSQMGRSIERKRKSLFLGDSLSSNEASLRACAKTSLNTMKDSKQPCFKASLLGSPFYPGRTMYGGAASSFYLNEPNIKQRKGAVVNEANNANNTISTAARRVMDLLEHYSSPLIDAKRIPQYTRSGNETTDLPSSLMNRINSYKTQELHVPSVASFLRLKQRNRLMDSTASARQIMASQSSTIDQPYSLGSDKDQGTKSSKYTSKVTSRLTRPKRGENNDFENDILPPVNLPTGGLQIDEANLPKFSFGTPKVSKEKTPYGSTLPKFGMAASTPLPVTSTVTSLSASKTTTTDVSLKKPNAIPNDAFKFSSPIRISAEQPLTNSKFTFVSPDRSVAKASGNAPCIIESTVTNETQPISKDWKCSDCWVSNKAEVDKCVCCGGKKPSQEPEAPPKCTVCKLANSQPHKDKCVNCEKAQNSVGQLSGNVTESSKWKCEDCWVSNDDTAEKCVCCGGKNPSKASTNVPTTQPTPIKDWKCDDCWVMNKIDTEKCVACGGAKPGTKKGTSSSISLSNTGGFKFGIQPASDSNANKLTNNWNNSKPGKTVTNSTSKQAGTEWRCADCWVMNKSDVEKCAACDGAKPDAKKERSTSAPVKAAESTFSNLVQSQIGKWECSSCLVRNDSDKLKCVCCEIEKPGGEKKIDTNKSFNFSNTTNTNFKFGIPNNQPEAAKVPETKSITEFSKKLESETNNNSLSKTPSFSFSLPDKKADTANKESSEKPKLGCFTFGMPSKPSGEIALSNETISKLTQSPAVLSKANVEEKEKEQEVPKMPMLADEAKSKSMPALLFTQPKQSSSDKLKNNTSLLSSVAPPEKKDVPSNPLLDPIATTTTSESQKPTFTFSSGSSIKLNSNLFTSTSTSSAATTALSFPPVNTAALSFSKTDATITDGLFQKTDTTAAPLNSTAPVFSFGSTKPAPPTVQSQTDSKPKFNFSFGSNNKTESPTVFKTPFGAEDSSNKAATFTLPTGNALSTVSSLPSGNSLTTTPAPIIFGAQVAQKENMWSTPASNAASTNLFVTNASTNAVQKPATFSFGSSTPFNSSGSTVAPAFGSNGASSAAPAFGSVTASAATPAFASVSASAAAPAFGSAATSPPAFGSATTGSPAPSATSAFGGTPSTNVFGLSNQNSGSQSSLFSSPVASPFGGGQATSNPPAALGMFGTPSAGATPTFGAPNPSSIPTFEAPSLTPAPAPAFSFGQPQSSAIFGFGQQQQAGVYSFGTAPGASPVQFNMGTGAGLGGSPSTAGRKIRKATRRANNPR